MLHNLEVISNQGISTSWQILSVSGVLSYILAGSVRVTVHDFYSRYSILVCVCHLFPFCHLNVMSRLVERGREGREGGSVSEREGGIMSICLGCVT